MNNRKSNDENLVHHVENVEGYWGINTSASLDDLDLSVVKAEEQSIEKSQNLLDASKKIIVVEPVEEYWGIIPSSLFPKKSKNFNAKSKDVIPTQEEDDCVKLNTGLLGLQINF